MNLYGCDERDRERGVVYRHDCTWVIWLVDRRHSRLVVSSSMLGVGLASVAVLSLLVAACFLVVRHVVRTRRRSRAAADKYVRYGTSTLPAVYVY